MGTPATRPRARAIAAVFAATAGLLPGPLSARQATGPVQTDSVLDNGLQVTVVENHDAPLAMVLLAVRAGAVTQEPGQEGLSHMYEHLLFRTYRGGPGDFAEDAGKLNAAYNGTTGAELVSYFMILPSEGVEDAIRQVARLVNDVEIESEDIREELPIVLDELALRGASPLEAMTRDVQRALWRDEWHRFDAGGDSVSLSALTPSVMQRHFERYYVPDNALLLVTGDADPERVFDWAEDRFGDWERGAAPVEVAPIGAAGPPAGTAVVLHEADVLEMTIHAEIQAPGTVDDLATLRSIEALVELLNEPSGELQRSLVVNGPFQLLEVSLAMGRSASSIRFQATAGVGEAEAAVRRFVAALGQIEMAVPTVEHPELGGPEERIERTVAVMSRRWELDLALTRESTAGIAPYMASLWSRGGGSYLYDEMPFEGTRTTTDFLEIARFVQGQPKAIGILAPGPTMASVRALLGGERP